VARIMIVDDSNAMRLVLRTILEGAGHEVVVEASDGKRAIVEYSRCKPDLVTMDITMPGLSGIEAIERLIRIDPAALILVVSSLGKKQVILEALQNGAKNFILKPFRDNQILTVVDMVLREYGPVKAPRQEYQSMAQA